MRALLGLGGNIGNPRVAMAGALVQLDEWAGRVVCVSRLYRTPPWGLTDQPDFLNCCALIDAALSPESLLQCCLGIEQGLQRVRDIRWGPRTIDIDLVDMEGERRDTAALTLPHPQAHRRAFVLVPLVEIAPRTQLSGRDATAWLRELDVSAIRAETTDGNWWRETA
ncbi:2-amino-4-hydroxy-6-hydroxymethyldihydropteridine diphosphokinase [Aureimonas jatrophae]|uniref:2-amino-4-hydroxy-6-hydroxymethyldihydropteridine pyrophosphokinase n=1 Tax=Aureimonas jatrophae TaxID=1166073 RepID=A0A1H0GIN5_9HYPH|nr:2-amino-4-hydroxy-6-hydroxymethyldihydropteridine diphosphokinase [Aureimonas jatrophae]MBB3949588.1 2-amino-4-hydroxy-6-hydroxymethyldihydropteridine diphosphokinase [Aureimonas jatrophae]SDO06713.1 2-amino-4-hydroxy-6-hydroxymethyldihydropteridinediphosphokinase [Aureimonas jatrophae]